MELILSEFENNAPLKSVQEEGAWAALHNYDTANEETKYNPVCYSRFFAVFVASRGFSLRTYFIFSASLCGAVWRS